METNELDIVLVEDNPIDAEFAIRALKAHNLADRLVWLKNGAEAIDFIFAQGQYTYRSIEDVPKVVLLDLKLPKVDGLEVLEKLKSDNRTRKIPIVVLTSSSEERDVIASYNLGVNSYVVKPIDFNKFIETVKEVGIYWLLLNKLPL